ncbi:hemicentin-2-like [Sycon ciliatum]|uniref:hemicentin-2-like n=1 Tax=Sycon ciliatum TaxID=27933 RepID=UPI0031F6337D
MAATVTACLCFLLFTVMAAVFVADNPTMAGPATATDHGTPSNDLIQVPEQLRRVWDTSSRPQQENDIKVISARRNGAPRHLRCPVRRCCTALRKRLASEKGERWSCAGNGAGHLSSDSNVLVPNISWWTPTSSSSSPQKTWTPVSNQHTAALRDHGADADSNVAGPGCRKSRYDGDCMECAAEQAGLFACVITFTRAETSELSLCSPSYFHVVQPSTNTHEPPHAQQLATKNAVASAVTSESPPLPVMEFLMANSITQKPRVGCNTGQEQVITSPSVAPESDPDSEPQSPTFNTRPPPFVLERSGQSLTLHCKAKGHPTPRITWLRGYRVIGRDSSSRVATGPGGSLHFRTLTGDDEYTYRCVAENSYGHEIATTNIYVQQ